MSWFVGFGLSIARKKACLASFEKRAKIEGIWRRAFSLRHGMNNRYVLQRKRSAGIRKDNAHRPLLSTR
jgi:hypothetical protein